MQLHTARGGIGGAQGKRRVVSGLVTSIESKCWAGAQRSPLGKQKGGKSLGKSEEGPTTDLLIDLDGLYKRKKGLREKGEQ